MFYRCELVAGEHSAGPESLDTRLYAESEIPWDNIAFPVISQTLREYFPDAERDEYPVRVSSVDHRPRPK
ncbi:MAG: NUDIX hydrolase, partial [Halieaceae bacterium]|nr:NUDIX hydrolase [Halieaceae bacterium]